MEIERKFLITEVPGNLASYKCLLIEQGYLSRGPVVRIRKQDDEYYLTYKGKGMMAREEYNLPLTEESYNHLKGKIDGKLISKRRYLIPFGDYTIELDHFDSPNDGLLLAEVEFPTIEEAEAFTPPEWFGEDVTYCQEYHNATMAYS